MMLTRHATRTVVKDHIYQWILDASAAPGEPLNVTRAAEALGVSATPVREALIELRAEGLLEAVQGRGFVVAPLEVREVAELYELIQDLEAGALAAAPEYSDNDLAELVARNADLAASHDDPGRAVRLDQAWHAMLLRGAPNRIGRGVLAALKRRVFRYEFRYMRETGSAPSHRQHAGIVEQLRRGDRAGAIALLRQNWSEIFNTVLPVVQEWEGAA